ncbi:hypothetical protein [Dyella japonica]|uniref:Uncharacterized protein n=1 Tax=Dyella japonica A8 TaxID=1217721 RepID=A0A075K1H5_9GAMM|nr:hypothetical protein [Dyella japonica]AIF47660.1 hypothetical protein HY57_10480 [Dyella japonica A8]
MEQAQAIHAAPTYSTLAIFSLAFGILAWTVLPVVGLVTAYLWLYNFIAMPLTGSAIALVCGQVAQRQIHRSNGALLGEGIAKAARIMATTQYALVALIAVFALAQIFLFHNTSTR